MDLEELQDPVEVWKAVEGDKTELIALLRSDELIRRRLRDALADYLEGTLTPVELPKGRPSKEAIHGNSLRFAFHHLYYGHDPRTELGFAGFHYERLRRFIRAKNWHINRPQWSDRLKEKIAERHGIELEKFINYLSRARPKPKNEPWSARDYIQRQRLEIALDVRRKKMREND